MPRKGSIRRSNGYMTTFLTCGDPKGVAEFGTVIKISKVSPEKRRQNKDVHRSKHKNLRALLAEESDHKDETNITTMGGLDRQQIECPSTLLPMQVSQGARNLIRVVNCWPDGPSSNWQPEDNKKDLLNGGMDLSESLLVVRQLEEASCDVSRLTVKHDQKVEVEGFDDKGEMDLMTQDLYENNNEEFERCYRFADGSSIKELKKENRERLARQNVASNIGVKVPCHRTRINSSSSSSSYMPSTSSSQSTTTINSSSLTSSSSSLSSTASQKRTMKSNLVAQLMGLESSPNSSPRRHIGNEKHLYPRRPVFDIDFLAGKKPQCIPQGSDTEDLATDEVVETMILKGLLKRNAVYQVNVTSHQLDAKMIDDRPPMVIIEPLPSSSSGLERTVDSKSPKDGSCIDHKTFIKSRSRPELARETIKSDPSASPYKCREAKANSSSFTSLHQEGVHCKRVLKESPEEIGAVDEEKKNSHKKNAEHLKKQKTAKRHNADQKTAAATGKPLAKKTLKPHKEVKSQDSTKLRASKLKKPGNGAQTAQNLIPTHQSAKARPISKCKTKSASCGSTDLRSIHQTSERTVIKRPPSTTAVGQKYEIQSSCADELVHGAAGTALGEHFAGDGVCESQTQISEYKVDDAGSLGKIMSMTTHEFLTNHEDGTEDDHPDIEYIVLRHNGTEDFNKDGIRGQHKPGDTSTLEITRSAVICDGIDVGHEDNTYNSPSRARTITTEEADTSGTVADHLIQRESCSRAKEKLKLLLLSSPSFVTHAEEIFHLETNLNVKSPTTTGGDSDASCSGALLDCAGEILELKHHQYAQSHPPLPHSMDGMSVKSCVSIDQILEETCEAIEALRYCSKMGRQTISSDMVYMLVDRDIKYAGITGRMWDAGWRNVFSADEIEGMLCEVEKLVFAGLVEEALEDLITS